MLTIIIRGGLVILTCGFFYLLQLKLTERQKRVIYFFYISLFIYRVIGILKAARFSIKDQGIFDFGAFYLWGKTASLGLNFYDPSALNHVYNLILPTLPVHTGSFIEEIVDVGFFYPPPTILYFTSLGFLSYKSALIVWTVIILIVAVLCVFLIYNLFLKKFGLNGFLLTGILFFSSSPVLSTVSYSQTNFIALLFLLMLWKYRDRQIISGIFLTLSVFTKPYMAILIFFFLFTKKWKAIGSSVISGITLSLITLFIFGKDIFVSYLFNGPTQKMPVWIYTEDINQSLNAVLLRNGIIQSPADFIYLAIFTLIAVLLTILYLVWKRLYDYILPVLLLAGLLVYPGTLSYYGVLLLFIIFQFFVNESQLKIKPIYNIFIVSICFVLSSASLFNEILFIAVVLALKVLIFNKKLSQAKFKLLQNK